MKRTAAVKRRVVLTKNCSPGDVYLVTEERPGVIRLLRMRGPADSRVEEERRKAGIAHIRRFAGSWRGVDGEKLMKELRP